MAGLTIGKFAAAAGVGVETVRFYQRLGLLAVPERQGSGRREYSEADARRLAFIRRAKRLGFTLSEIGDMIGTAEVEFTDDIARAATARLDQTGERLAELAVVYRHLHQRLQACAEIAEQGRAGEGRAERLPGPGRRLAASSAPRIATLAAVWPVAA